MRDISIWTLWKVKLSCRMRDPCWFRCLGTGLWLYHMIICENILDNVDWHVIMWRSVSRWEMGSAENGWEVLRRSFETLDEKYLDWSCDRVEDIWEDHVISWKAVHWKWGSWKPRGDLETKRWICETSDEIVRIESCDRNNPFESFTGSRDLLESCSLLRNGEFENRRSVLRRSMKNVGRLVGAGYPVLAKQPRASHSRFSKAQPEWQSDWSLIGWYRVAMAAMGLRYNYLISRFVLSRSPLLSAIKS